jgi:hypothetical protein
LASWYAAKERSAAAIGSGIESFGKSVAGIPGAIQSAQADKTANSLSSQLANSGNYAPHAALVNPGIDPITQSINTVKGPAGNPFGVNPATQGAYTGSSGTPPVVAQGGMEGLKARIAIANLQREQSGGTPVQQAIEQARLANTQSSTANSQSEIAHRTWQENQQEQDRIDAKQRAEDIRTQAAWDKGHTHTPATLASDIIKTSPGKDAEPWQTSLTGNTGHQGSFVNGVWKNDPQNGAMYSVDDIDGNGGIPDGTPQNQMKNYVGIDTAKRWRSTYDNIQQNNGSWIEPRPNAGGGGAQAGGGGGGGAQAGGGGGGGAQTPSAGGGGSIPKLTDPSQVNQLPSTTQYFQTPDGRVKNNPNYRP